MSTRALVVCLVAGGLIRLALLVGAADLEPQIADEHHYVQLAESLVDGRGFAWSNGTPTSLRPPLYPALIASVWMVTGVGNFQAVRVVQFVLALATAVLAYAIGRQVFSAEVGRVAFAVTWLEPSLIFLNVLMLGETLFTLLLVAFVLLAVILVRRRGPVAAAACGLALGLGALTRSVLWPVPLLLCPLLVLLIEGPYRRRLALTALVFAGYAVAVGPWAVRNTRLQRVPTVVDTMGGMNLRMGNYEHTPEDRMWDAVSQTGEKNWVYALTQEGAGQTIDAGSFTEGMKDKWAQRKAIEYIRAHPGVTARRAVIKFSDFWGPERSFIAGVQQGLYHPPLWFTLAATATMLAFSAAVPLMAAGGIWLTPPPFRFHVLLLLPVVVIAGVHTIVFGHPRYRLPLTPVLAVYGAAWWHAGVGATLKRRRAARIGAIASMALLAGIWIRQAVIVDAARLRAFVDAVWPGSWDR